MNIHSLLLPLLPLVPVTLLITAIDSPSNTTLHQAHAIHTVRLAEMSDSATKAEGQFLQNTRQLIYEGKRSGEGYFDRDGKRLIFQSEREAGNPFYQIYILDFASGETKRISNGMGKTTCAYFRWGQERVLYASTHLDTATARLQQEEIAFRASGKKRRYAWDYDENYDIFDARTDGTDTRRLTESIGYDAEGSYSPDGSKIVFCSFRHAYPTANLSPQDQKRMETDPAWFGEIYIMDADGGNVKRLTNWEGYDGGPFFSPDGQRIIFRHFAEDGMTADVFTMRLDGTDIRRITDFESMSWAPFFHPSGQYCIFTSNKYGFANFELFIVDTEGRKEPVRITYTDGFDGLPVFSPDGRTLVWSTNRTADGASQLFIADWQHDAALQALAAAPLRKIRNLPPPPTGQRTSAAPGSPAPSSFTPAILASELNAKTTYLANDEFEGRMTGTPAAMRAAQYLSERFAALKLKAPFPQGYTQPFEFNTQLKDRKQGAEVKELKGVCRNVIGILPPTGTVDEYIVVGAHYDHIGRGVTGSLARAGEENQIHNGADDNASGVAVVLELAEALSATDANQPNRRGIIFALWSGEELGIIGSTHFTKNPPVPLDKIVGYVNFDMVGRLRDNRLALQGTGSSSYWAKVIEKRNIAAGFNISMNPDPYLPTDASAFYLKGVPVLSFFTGQHEDYNRPTDDADKLNTEGMARITRFAKLIIDDLSTAQNRPDYLRVENTKTSTKGSSVYLGTIPDYVAAAEGVKLSGVKAGGPAEKAGLVADDIIVNLNGKAIKTIYDYTAALDGLEVGKTVDITVIRKGKHQTLRITPEAR